MLAIAIDRTSEDAYPGAPCGACPKCGEVLTLLCVDPAKKSKDAGAHRGQAMCSGCVALFRVKVGGETSVMRELNAKVAKASREIDAELTCMFAGQGDWAV